MVASFEERFALIEAKEQIRELLGRFTLCLDATIKEKGEEQRKAFAQVHSKDAVFIHPIANITGGEDIATLAVEGLKAFSQAQHFLGQPKFTALDVEAGTAAAICDAIYTHVWKPRDGYINEDHLREFTQTGGKYHFELRRERGQWLITRNNYIPAWYIGAGPVL